MVIVSCVVKANGRKLWKVSVVVLSVCGKLWGHFLSREQFFSQHWGTLCFYLLWLNGKLLKIMYTAFTQELFNYWVWFSKGMSLLDIELSHTSILNWPCPLLVQASPKRGLRVQAVVWAGAMVKSSPQDLVSQLLSTESLPFLGLYSGLASHHLLDLREAFQNTVKGHFFSLLQCFLSRADSWNLLIHS